MIVLSPSGSLNPDLDSATDRGNHRGGALFYLCPRHGRPVSATGERKRRLSKWTPRTAAPGLLRVDGRQPVRSQGSNVFVG